MKITLMEAIRSGKLELGQKVKLSSTLFQPYPLTTIESKESGIKDNQTVFRKERYFYFAGIENGDVIKFIKASTDDLKITLKGVKGFENGLAIMNRICSDLFSDPSLGIFSVPLEVEEFKEYFLSKKTEKFTDKIVATGEAFLATQYIKKDDIPNLSYGFKCFLGNVELVNGNNEKSFTLGFVPTIKMYFPERLYVQYDEETPIITK